MTGSGERERLMAEQERLLREGVPIEALERVDDDLTDADRRWACNRPAVSVAHPRAADENGKEWCDICEDEYALVHPEPGDRAEQVEIDAYMAASEAWMRAGARGPEALREALWAAQPILVAAAVAADEESAVLAGQVAAIRALPDRQACTCRDDTPVGIGHHAARRGYNEALAVVRAALVASSPTTPEAKK